MSVFSSLFLSNITQSYTRTNPVQQSLTQKMFSTARKVLKEQFSKMEDAGNIEVPESSSTPTSARTFENFGPGTCNSISVNFTTKIRDIQRFFLRYPETIL